jgi:NDP-sugar pyrophosphorylase family protein
VIVGFVLAGGRGTRLHPYTTILPKPLMPLGNSTILENLLLGLADSGITNVTISLGYLGHLVRAVINDGEALGVDARYTVEEDPLGTAGSLRLLAEIERDDVVVVVNGDTWTHFDYNEAILQIDKTRADAIIVCKERTTKIDFGVITMNDFGILADYIEKPTTTHLVSTGINVIRGSAILDWLPEGDEGKVDMPKFLEAIQSAGGLVSCMKTDAPWLDLGRPEDLIKANEKYEDIAVRSLGWNALP